MTNPSRTCAVIIALLLCVGATTNAQTPKILLTDSFERVTGNHLPAEGDTFTDWGMNDNANGGTIVQTYLTTPSRPPANGGVDSTVQEADDPADGDNEGVIRFGVTAVDYNLATDPDVLFGGGYTVEFLGRRAFSDPTTAGFLSFFFGTDPGLITTTDSNAAFLPVTSLNAGEHGYLFQRGGFEDLRLQVFESGSKLDPPGDLDFLAGLGSTDFFTAKITVLAPDGFDIGDTLNVSLDVNGSTISDAAHTVDVAGAFPGYIGWSSNTGFGTVDNLVITALDTAPVTGLAGDYNDDDRVDAIDYAVWRENLGLSALALNGNGTNDPSGLVVQADFTRWLNNFGAVAGTTAPAPAPEPATLVLLLAPALLHASRRRGRWC